MSAWPMCSPMRIRKSIPSVKTLLNAAPGYSDKETEPLELSCNN